jgi:hypothetical protein
MAVPFFRHWYPSGAVPVAATEKVAFCPVVTFWLTGWAVMDGAIDPPVTLGLIALVTPAHPERKRLPNRIMSPNF